MAEKKKTPNEIFRELRGNAGGSESTRQTPNEVFAQIMSRANAANHVKEANRFIVDINKFSRAVDEDTSGENQFNAADYFEERKQQAEQLKQRAAAMTLYMDDHRDSFSDDSYERMMNILSTFDTDVDDVMSRYQPSLDAKAGMRAYEDELSAAMDRNAQLQQVYDLSDRYSDRPVGAMYDLMNMFRKPADESDRAVKDNWTAEQRYLLGTMQMEDPNAAKEYAKNVNAGKDPYLLYQQQEQQKANWLAMDLDAEKREIDRLKAELDDYYWNSDYDATDTNARNAFDQEVKRREKEISDREQQYNLAKREQDSAQLRSAVDQSDFSAKSGYVGTGFEVPKDVNIEDPQLVYEYINNPEIRSQVDYEDRRLAMKGYHTLKPEEVSLYNYHYATEGPERAQQYLDNLQTTLSDRMGEDFSEQVKDSTWKQYLFGAAAGLTNAVESTQNLFSKEDYIPLSPYQYASAKIREDLADTGPVLPGVPGGASMGQVAFDLVNTTANMVPSILLSTAANAVLPGSGAFVGAATMGLSSAGGAYQQALNAGYSKEQSRAYAALSGASEAGMEYLLGGISKLGGEIPQKVLNDMVRGVDNAIAKAALTIGGDMVSEGFEEGLQEIITPWLENLVLYADKDVNLDDVAYSTLLGALSGGVMEGPRVSVNTTRVSRVDKQLQNLGAKGNTWDLAELIVKHRSGEQLSQEDYIKLVKSEPAMKILDGMRSAEPTEPAIANMTAEQVDEMKPSTSADGNARQISRNASINVVEFADIKDGKATVKTDSGSVDYSDVSFGTEKQGNQYFAVESLPSIDTAHANELLKTIQTADVGNDTAEVVAIRESYRLGYMGAKTSELRGSDASILPTNLQDQIYSIGKEQRTVNDSIRATAAGVRAEATKGYKKVVIEGKLSKLDGKRKAEIAYMDRVADEFAGNAVHVYESYKKNGKMYYRDNSGKEQLAPNGKYVNGEIWVDLNSGDKGEGLVLNTFAHEMYHHIEEWNKPKARELAEFVVKELGLESVDKAVQKQIDKARAAGWGEAHFESNGMSKEQAANEVYMRAMSDFVADSLETMFTRGDPAKAIANLKKENKGLFDQIKAFIDEWISKVKKFYGDKTISQEGAVVAQLEKFEQLQQMFMEAMQGAGENYNAALESITPGEAGIMVNEDGDPVAMSTEDGSVMLSIRTYEEDGREAFRKYLDKCVTSNRLTEEQAKEMRDGIEEIYNVCKEFKDKYAPFSTWSDAEVIRDTRGRPVFSVVTPNGDYKMNLDFSLVCKKRRTLDAVFNEMSRRGIIDDFELGQKSVVKINEIIRKHGLETACALCFVDAKRFRQASMADSFTRLYNELVESLVPEDQRGSINHFNFSGYETIKKVDGGIDTWDNSKLDFSHLDDVMKRYGKGTVEHKAARYIKNNPQGRKLLLRGDFMSSQGFDAVKTQNKDILKLYNSKKGTGGPKAAFGDVQYLNEIIKKERTWTPSKAYEVGGIRIQSFSDYVPRMVFDYTQMIYDLAARKLPAHAYTKESLFVKQFGLTGVKINMSLIPAVAEGGIAAGLDDKGNYVWAGESFNYDEAVDIQNAEGYTENCGTICVGVSKQHIEKLLRDPNIRMVIPYHKSGLNPIVAHMNKIAEFTDYTNDQRTKGKDGKAISKDFNFNEAVKRTGDPKTAANEYLKWCADNGYTPKFDEFKGEENYYKLLEDFTLYDKDGKYVPQREVRAAFPSEGSAFGTMKDLIKAGLKEDAIVEGKRDKNLSSIVDEIQKTLPKTEAEISEEQVKQADRDLEAQHSLRNQQPTAREILMQTDPQTQKNNVKGHLTRYQERVVQLNEAESRREEVKAQIETLSADPKKNRKELAQLRTENRNLTTQINGLKEKLKFSENTDMMRRIVANERLKNQPTAKSYKDEQEDFIRSMLAEHRVIRKELTGADSVMFVMEDTFVKLAKDYEAKKIDMKTMEKEFMRIMKEYEKQTEKSGKKAKSDSEKIEDLKAQNKIWLREYKRLMKEYDLSDRKIARLEATIARQRATAKARVEGRRKTEMRHKIQRKVNELDQLLRHGTKHRNVPEFLQDSVAAVLQAINMEVRDSDQRKKTYEATIARYDRQIELATDPLVKEALIEKRDNYAAKGDQFANRMVMLQKAYEQIRKENTGLELDEGIAERLNSLFETVGNTPLGQMSTAQLDAVNDILNVTMATVRNANEMLAEARSAGVVESSKSAIMEIKSAGETKKKKTRLRKNLEQFGWNNLKPVYAFDVIGSKTLTDRYEALRKGEDTLAVDLNEAKEFFQEQWKKNGGKEWDMDQKWKFTSTSGKSFELDLNQIMSLYAMAKDQDARSHLRVGGFAFDSDYQTNEDINLGPVKIPVKVESTDASAYNLSDEILGEIISKLTPQQRAFADAMQAYLSDTMAAKGNEVSLKKYGIRLFKKKDYFPIRVADQFMAKAREQQSGDREIKNSGFTKDRKPEAKNPVVLSGFTEVWAEHVDEMSLYHSFVLPLDDFNRVLNYHDAFVEGEQAASVVEAITNAFGKGAVNYIDQLIKDVNGGIKGGSTVSFANSLVSKAKKAQTMASLSVAIQQPSSIIRAMSEVDTKYFYGPRVTEKSHDRTWDEIKKHAPIAIIKEMGGYDTNVGKSTVDYLTDTADYDGFGEKFKAMFTDEKFRDDALGRLPALMDEMAWGVIWNAVKREQRDRHPNMDTKSDAFMKLVANRFTEVITRTQVYDSVFSRSGLMRDRKSDLAKMITSFMAEPTTTANMLAVSILQASRGDIKGKQAAKTVGSIVASLALNAALVSVIYALRDDDEDKRYDEKYVENFRNNFFESLNPLGYIPYVRDIYNLFAKGYDVERADMELFGDLQNAIEGLGNEDITAWEKTENVIGAIGNLLGVPVKNILRDVKGFVQTVGFAWDDRPNPKTKTGTYMAWRGMDLNDKEQMILAIQSGDEEHLQRVFGRFDSQQQAESALQSAIKAKYLEDGLTAEETKEMLTTYFDRDDEFEIYWLMEEWDYAKANDGSTDGYTKYGSLYEAIETGDFETEIARFLEHGADASTIRSQITREYRKQYLADETAREDIREKLLPVYEATGMYASDIEDKFNDWDFEAEYGMTYSNFKAEYREGNVTEAEMRGAMDAYGLLNYEIEEGIRDLNDDITFEKKFGMSLSELKDAYDNGDATRNQLIEALMFTGKTKTEATEEVSERDLDNRFGIQYAKLDDAYKYNDISRSEFYNAMREHGATKQEADEAILGYDWLKKNVKKYPDLAISDAKRFVIKVSDKMEERTLTDYGVSVDAYIKYKVGAKDCPGVDADGDGHIDAYSKAKQLFAMIDKLPITDEAKDGLALVTNAESTLRKYAPWRK